MATKLKVPRGSWEPIRVLFRNADGSAEDMTDYVVHLVVGRARDGSAELFRLRSTEAEECSFTALTGNFLFYCLSSFTEELTQGTTLWYDVWTRSPGGELQQRVAPTQFEIGPRVPDEVDIPAP